MNNNVLPTLNSSANSLKSLPQNETLVTTKELATVLNVEVTAIKRAVKKLGAVLHQVKTNNQGGYLFTEEQATLIKQEIQKHHNLANRHIDSVSTDYEMELMTQKVIAFHIQKANELKTQIEMMKPKADFYDQVTGSSDAIEMKEVAKVLNFKGLGRNNLFELLRKTNILDKNNIPYQQYVDSGYFRVIESKWNDAFGDTHINLKTVVYQKGVDYIRKVVLTSSEYISNSLESAADSFIEKGEREYQKIVNKTAEKWIDTELNSNPKSSCIFKAE